MTGSRPLLFGEVLFDRFPDGTAVLGGAPVNVAAHLAGLGFDPVLVSRVGSDPEGLRAVAELSDRGLDTACLEVDPAHGTGAVEVEIEQGEPRFAIAPDRAWDRISAAAVDEALARTSIAVAYHGTLAARGESSRAALERLRGAVGAPLFVDVNLRPPWTPIERARELGRGVAWLKVNREELAALLGAAESREPETVAAQARELLDRLGPRRLVVSDGQEGALLLERNGGTIRAPAPRLDPGEIVDTIGAGDALAATLLAGELAGWPPATALERGVELAAAICRERGALPALPDFHRPYRVAWGLGT